MKKRLRQKSPSLLRLPTPGNVIGWCVFAEPIHFNMERKMLQGIKARAEAAAN